MTLRKSSEIPILAGIDTLRENGPLAYFPIQKIQYWAPTIWENIRQNTTSLLQAEAALRTNSQNKPYDSNILWAQRSVVMRRLCEGHEEKRRLNRLKSEIGGGK